MKKMIFAVLILTLSCALSCEGGGSSGGGDDGGGGYVDDGGGGYVDDDGGGGGTTTANYTVTIKVNGDNNSNGIADLNLDDARVPFDGDEIIYYFDKLAQIPPASAPQMVWDSTENAYVEVILDVTAEELNNFWVLIAQPDPGAAAQPGAWSPVFGVFIEIKDKDENVCTDLMVHYVLIGEDPNGNYIYGAQIQNLNTATGCISQLEDNRTVVFGL